MEFTYRDAFVAGNRKVLKELIDQNKAKFNALLKKYGAEDHACAEYFQLALKSVSENFILDPIKQVPDHKFFNYFATIGLNKWRSYCRSNDRKILHIDTEIMDLAFEESVLADIVKQEEHEIFMKHFKMLDKNCQHLLWSKIVEGLSYEEIAENMQKSAAYLRVQLTRCKKYIKTSLGNDNKFDIS